MTAPDTTAPDSTAPDSTAPGAAPRYAYLGPAGTFTEEALHRVVSADAAQLLPQTDVIGAIERVREGQADYAVVAIENSVEGGVTAVLDALAEGEPLVITREILVPVSFTLAALPGTTLEQVKQVAAHPHAWAQCRRWARHHLPGATHVSATSNTSSAALMARVSAGELAAELLDFDAALVPPAAVEHYRLAVLASGVADNPSAVTRFVLVRRPGPVPAPTGADKTTLTVALPDERAGALLELLEQFSTRGINLTRIESRPSGDALGRYLFSIDAEAHVAEPRMAEALVGLHRFSPRVRYLGSYPKADFVPTRLRPGTEDAAYGEARAWVADVQAGRSV
ncbi:MAG: prephenate dehydratase [Bifidobacteriaceae bacterium]|jgi:prephenate dehydratase|nr:prephenate dehydratase [Bifidobacteriaceae bacterium]